MWGYSAEEIGVHAGDAKYKDLNGDGKIDDNDRTNIGNPFPWLTYGLNLGAEFYGFDVQLFFQGVYGNQIYNALRERTEGAGSEATLSTSMSDVWVGYSDLVRNAMLAQGMFIKDPFDDATCRQCKVLPLCGGGCPAVRMKLWGTERQEQCCSLYRGRVEQLMPYMYEQMKK